jgi:hypothetical protein
MNCNNGRAIQMPEEAVGFANKQNIKEYSICQTLDNWSFARPLAFPRPHGLSGPATRGGKTEVVVLREIEVQLKAQFIVFKNLRDSACSVYPIPLMGLALNSVQHEECQKEAAMGGSKRLLHENPNVCKA